MDYKVIKYRCGCKYILITDPEKIIMKRSERCPVHWKAQEYTLLWCLDCGKRLKVSPRAGHNQKRCVLCAKERTKKKNREAWQTKYKGRYKKNGQTRYAAAETKKKTVKRFVTLKEVAGNLREKYRPPEVRTPILDRFV